MQAITDTQVRHLIFAGVTRRQDFSFKPSTTKSARHQDSGSPLQHIGTVSFDFFSIDVVNLNRSLGLNARVGNGLDERLVGVEQFQILTDKGDLQCALWRQLGLHDALPVTKLCFLTLKLQEFHNIGVQTLLMQL